MVNKCADHEYYRWDCMPCNQKVEKEVPIGPTNEQLLDSIPIDEVVEYVLENYFDMMKEAMVEQSS